MKSDYLTNPLQKELFSKVVDLLLDQPRRLNHNDAEMALTEAWRIVFHRSLSPHVMVNLNELEKRHEILATGLSPVHAVLAYCKKDDDIHSYSIDENSVRKQEDGSWAVNFKFNADQFTAQLVETRGGFVMISYSHRTEPKAKGKDIHSAIVHLMRDNGWPFSVCVDVLSVVDLENDGWRALAEVHHYERKKVVVEGIYAFDSVVIENWRYGNE